MNKQRAFGFTVVITAIALAYGLYLSKSTAIQLPSNTTINIVTPSSSAFTQPPSSASIQRSFSKQQQSVQKSTSEITETERCQALFNAITNGQKKLWQDTASDVFSNCAESIATSNDIDAIIRFCVAWAHLDLLSALQFAAALDQQLRPYVLPKLVQKMAAINTTELETWLALQNSDDVNTLKHAFYRGLTELDPQRALNAVLSLTTISKQEAEQKKYLIISVLEQWGESNAELALDFVRQQKIHDKYLAGQMQFIETQLMIQLIKQNDQAAEKMILELNSDKDKAVLVQHMVQYLAEIDQQLAVEWAQKIQDPQTREAAIGSAFQHWIETDIPAETIVSAIQNEPNLQVRLSLTHDAVNALAHRNSQELAEIYELFSGSEQPYIAEKIASSWANSDHQSALNWASSLPNGEAKDAAIYSIATQNLYSFEQPELALNYAQLITDPNIQFETNKAIVLNIANDNKRSAINLIEQIQGLNHQQKQALYQLLK